ncbi:hypothetical protein, partial [Klebsiella pneumoniae]|uniref:hypothetical protein n=2 Tax=Klebsiella pneumoniae TaxID=573 RepID=UPI001D0F6072
PLSPKPHSKSSQIVLTSLSPAYLNTTQRSPLIPNIHSSNIPPNPTHHHSNIFQKVLANAFLLFTRSAAKY